MGLKRVEEGRLKGCGRVLCRGLKGADERVKGAAEGGLKGKGVVTQPPAIDVLSPVVFL